MLVLELKKGWEIILTDRISKSVVVIKSNHRNGERIELCFDAPRTIGITRQRVGNSTKDVSHKYSVNTNEKCS